LIERFKNYLRVLAVKVFYFLRSRVRGVLRRRSVLTHGMAVSRLAALARLYSFHYSVVDNETCIICWRLKGRRELWRYRFRGYDMIDCYLSVVKKFPEVRK